LGASFPGSYAKIIRAPAAEGPSNGMFPTTAQTSMEEARAIVRE
jgi:hypothetical protein